MPGNLGDTLLQWMSWERRGRISDVQERLVWLASGSGIVIPQWQVREWVRVIDALGHCDVDWKRERWEVRPPALSQVAGPNVLAVRTGRMDQTLERLLKCRDVTVHRLNRPKTSLPDVLVPTTLIIEPLDPDLLSISEQLGLEWVGRTYEDEAAALTPIAKGRTQIARPPDNTLLERLAVPPSADSALGDSRGAPRFLRSREIPFRVADGSFRWTEGRRKHHAIVREGAWFEADRAECIHLELSRLGKSSMSWHATGSERSGVGRVVIASGCFLPRIHARTLTLCSGVPPHVADFPRGDACYLNVPRRIAELVATVLGQDLAVD